MSWPSSNSGWPAAVPSSPQPPAPPPPAQMTVSSAPTWPAGSPVAAPSDSFDLIDEPSVIFEFAGRLFGGTARGRDDRDRQVAGRPSPALPSRGCPPTERRCCGRSDRPRSGRRPGERVDRGDAVLGARRDLGDRGLDLGEAGLDLFEAGRRAGGELLEPVLQRERACPELLEDRCDHADDAVDLVVDGLVTTGDRGAQIRAERREAGAQRRAGCGAPS